MNISNLFQDALLKHQNGDLLEARKIYYKIISIDNNPRYLRLLGLIEIQLSNFDLAIKILLSSLDLDANNFDALVNLGIAYKKIRKFNLAELYFFQSILVNPKSSAVYNNLGSLYHEYGDFNNAIKNFDYSLDLDQLNLNSRYNKANLLKRFNFFHESQKEYEIIFNLQNFFPLVLSSIIECSLFIAEWFNLNNFKSSMINENDTVHHPLATLLLIDNLYISLSISNKFSQKYLPFQLHNMNFSVHNNNKIKLGFFSADFRFHPVAIWLVEQVENHDKTQFELFAFSLRSVIKDPMQERLKAAFDHFIEVDTMSDSEVVMLSRQLEIDIALDLGGHTQDSRPGIFALRAAPIQVSHLGFPGTSGADYIDFFMADEHMVPMNSQKYFTEKIAYVSCLTTYDRERKICDDSFTRSDFGLPETGFVFTCQNGVHKILPEVFTIWMRLLLNVPGSVLWLQEPQPTALENLKKEAIKRGVDASRLVFLKKEIVPPEKEYERIGKYLATYKLADLFLDTSPYNGGTTVVDALLVGLPVITKTGETVVSRLATSALNAIEMPELITKSEQEYEELALELATNKVKLSQIKEKLAINKNKTSLFDPINNIRNIEKKYIELIQNYNDNYFK